MAMEITREKILEFMRVGAGRPLSFRDLVRKWAVVKAERDPLKALLKEMVADGSLVRIRGARYGLPARMNLVTGTLQCHPRGFGFVTPEDGADGGGDVFIGRTRMKGAMHGDHVVSRVEGSKEDGKREGSIIRILERANRTVVGKMKRVRGLSVVIPSNERILEEIVIPARAKAGGGAKDGVIVVVEITRWPEKHMAPAGRVIDILGDPEDADVEIEVIVRKYGLPLRFPDEVLNEAAKVGDTVSEEETQGRKDLRALKTVTIDGESAKDFDDAVTVEKIRGGYRLFVSIADVSHYVTEGSVLDQEAYRRSTSVYFPDRCVPMLPERLSNGICSLNPKVDRLTMTVEMTFDNNGRSKGKKLYRSVIQSKERLTYTSVRGVLEGDAKLRKKYAHLAGELTLMEELAKKLFARRVEKGSIDFDLPEPQIIIDIEGRIEDIVRSERNVAHRLIEEFMLAANRAVAEEFKPKDRPLLHRVHPRPDAESIDEFREFAAGLGYALKLPQSGRPTPKTFQKVLAACEGKPEERLINHVLLRAMKRAEYSPENIGHFGLAFNDYAHFTSPIRRYPDLVVHRLVKRLINKRYGAEARKRTTALLPAVAAHTSEMERKAMEAEREVVDLKKAQFMADKVGETYDGLISGVTSFGLFVELKDYFVEGLIHVTTLTDDYYEFLEKEHTLRGENTKRTLRVGDEVTVVIEDVSIELRRIDMVLGPEDGGGREKKADGKKRGGKKAPSKEGVKASKKAAKKKKKGKASTARHPAKRGSGVVKGKKRRKR